MQKLMKVPSGLVKCEVCGEYKGNVKEKDLNWEGHALRADKRESDAILSVSCLCDGVLCPRCKRNKMRRPISNSYDETTNQVWHTPVFIGMAGCSQCRNS